MADEFAVSITGGDALKKALADAGGLAVAALASAMVAEQNQVMAQAKRLTPVDSGALRASGTVLDPKIEGTSVEVTAGFGGAASAYAIPVHERLGVHHPSGQAKFLEQPFLERSKDMPAKLAAGIAKALERMRK